MPLSEENPSHKGAPPARTNESNPKDLEGFFIHSN
jgi:hypothetical protein